MKRSVHRPVADRRSARGSRAGLLAWSLALAALGCASRGAEVRAPKQALFRPAPEPGAPDVPWARKTRDERMEYMGLYVFPKMRTIFRAFDGKAYAAFRCQTCHGEDMEAVGYKMPNGLYALPSDGPERAALDYVEKTARFMIGTVLPAMRELLSVGDASGASSVACKSCHPTE